MKTTKRADSGKTTYRATPKRVTKLFAQSVSHCDSTIEWLQRDPNHAAALLEAALETGDAGDFMSALRMVADARGGVTRIAEETGLNREALYRTLSRTGNPQLSSLLPILHAAGLRLSVQVT